LFHSLRIIPPILEICEDVTKICPQAVVFNFSNPMSRICTTVGRRFPDLQFVGLCHEIGSLRIHLPLMLGVPYEDLHVRAAGLNHFSVLLQARYRDTGEDAYPAIREKAQTYFDRTPSFRDVMMYIRETGKWPSSIDDLQGADLEPWPERDLFRVILEKFGYLPITTDSHFGEYIQWAHEAVDHRGILEFYHNYKSHLSRAQPKIELRLDERVVPIIEGILTDSGYEEEAVDIPNKGLIADLPEWLVVEVPGTVDKAGVHGVPMGRLPHGIAGLVSNQAAVHDLTAEAVLTGSKNAVLQALLVDPIVDKYAAVEEMVDTMLALQADYLGYIH
jgi:alpha-galactosidase